MKHTPSRCLIYTKPRPYVQDPVTTQTLLLDAKVEAFDISRDGLTLELTTTEVLEYGVADWFRVVGTEGEVLFDGDVSLAAETKHGDLTVTTLSWAPGDTVTVGPIKARGPSG